MGTNFKILEFSEKDLSLPNPFDCKGNEVDIEIKPFIRFSNKRNIIIMQIEISYFQKENLILNYGVALSFGMIKNNQTTDLTKTDVLSELLEVTVGFTRGAMATYTKNTPLKKLILPFINLNALLSKAVLMNLDDK